MHAIGLLFVGAMFGATASVAFVTGYSALDSGVSQTYRCDQLGREADARQSAALIIQSLLATVGADEFEGVLKGAGLKSQQVAKRDHVIVIVGQTSRTAAMEFRISGEGKVDLLALPGSMACDPGRND